jgi:hypothetical protein
VLTLASVVVASAVTVVWTCWVVESCSEVAVAATVVIGIPFNQIAYVSVVNQFVFVHKGSTCITNTRIASRWSKK